MTITLFYCSLEVATAQYTLHSPHLDLNIHVQYAITWDKSFFFHASLYLPAVSNFQRLLVLEAEHGPLPGTTSTLTDVINYLENVV